MAISFFCNPLTVLGTDTPDKKRKRNASPTFTSFKKDANDVMSPTTLSTKVFVLVPTVIASMYMRTALLRAMAQGLERRLAEALLVLRNRDLVWEATI